MSSTQHQLIEQCAIRLRGIVEALDNIHDNTPHRWSTDLDDVHSSAESLLALIKDQAPPSEDQLIAAGLSYPLAKEDAVQLWYAGFRSEVVTVLEAWEAIGHDIGMNPSKGELLDSLRNMAAICNAHGNDMPAQSAIDQRQAIADAITGALAFGAQASRPPPADHWLRPFYDIGRAEGQRTQELAMLVRMLASSLKRHAPESNLVARATNYLAAKGLAGTPLRDAPASVEQAGGDERAAFNHWIAEQQLCQGSDISLFTLERNGALVSLHDLLRDAYQAGQARAALAQPSPVPELERPEVVAYLFVKPDGTLSMDAVRHKPSQPAVAVMTVAQHESIVGALRAELESERNRVNIYVNNNGIRQDNERLRAELRAALDFIAPDGTAGQLESEACIEWRQQDADFLEAGLYAFCAEYPEEGGVLLDEEPATAQPSPKREQRLVECDACPTSGGCVEKCMKAPTQPSPAQGVQENSGYDQLWAWFGLSRSAYAVLPRVMMHAMPDDWQRRFAELMDEWDDHWPNQPDINARVHITQNGLYISTPKWLLDYRHPDHNQLNAMRGKDEL
ncbi:TPA: hypothetical protein ACXI3H_005401 [Pseudomonas aeruginosa]